MELALRGIGVSPGVAIGPAVLFRVQSIEVPHYRIDDAEAEIARFDQAVKRSREELTHLWEQTRDELGERHAAVFAGHLEMLDDVALRPEVIRRLETDGLNVEYGVDQLIGGYTKMLGEVDDPLFRERSSDFVDVGRRILSNLLDRKLNSLEHLAQPCVIVAHDLTPSETANMDTTNTLGLALDGGGRTSHMAILARALEIPAVVGLRYAGVQVAADDVIVVDGTNGHVIIRPEPATLDRFQNEKERQEEDRRVLLQAETDGPSVTLDGLEIPTLANIELPMETEMSKRAKCQGIGLYRTEYLFMNRVNLPSEEEQFQAYRQVIESMGETPVTIRTLDIGGDKIVPHLGLEEETNPQLGWRAIRFCLDRPDVFKAQLRALYRASVYGNLQIMFPMISGVDIYREARQVAEEVRDDLKARGISFREDMKIGSMIEVPAVVAVAEKLAKECDFFSIGTNDLIQYGLAVDRVNERTTHLYEPAHPGILALLKQTIDAAKKAGIPCSICGEVAGDPMFTELLLGMGFEVLSMSAVSIPIVRAEIANTKSAAAKRFARKALSMSSGSEVRTLLEQRYKRRGTMKLYRRGRVPASRG